MIKIKSKKGISTIISYVLVVILSLVLAGVVYSTLKLEVPQELTECNPDLSLILTESYCDADKNVLRITIQNDGLFNVEGVFIRFAEQGKTVRRQINEGKELFVPSETSEGGIKPNQALSAFYNVEEIINPLFSNYVIEIQPAIFTENQLLPCKGKIIAKNILCEIGEPSPEGNGVCDAGECTSYPSDCSFEDCCGDGICNNGENPTSCSTDCSLCGNGNCDEGECLSCFEDCNLADCCPDGICNNEEDGSTCPEDCVVCGDGYCDFSEGESRTNCPADCTSDGPPSDFEERDDSLEQQIGNLEGVEPGLWVNPGDFFSIE